MAKGITLKTKNGATGYPKSVTDLIFDNATGKTLKTLIEELKAIDAATDTRTQFYKASETDLDALNAAANIGTYNYVGNGWRGLVQVCLDHSSNVAQVALSSSSPSYDGNVLSWIAAQPCAMARVYRNGAWSHWEKVGAPVVNDLTTGGTDKALSAEMGKTLKEGLDALGPKIGEDEELTLTIERGAISSSNGSNSSSTTRLRTNGYVEHPNIRVEITSGKYYIFGYDANGYVAADSAGWRTSSSDISMEGCTKYRIVFSFDDNATINTSDFPTLGVKVYCVDKSKKTVVLMSDVVNDLTTGGTNVPLSAEQGKILSEELHRVTSIDVEQYELSRYTINSDGVWHYNSTAAQVSRSRIIPIEVGKKYRISTIADSVFAILKSASMANNEPADFSVAYPQRYSIAANSIFEFVCPNDATCCYLLQVGSIGNTGTGIALIEVPLNDIEAIKGLVYDYTKAIDISTIPESRYTIYRTNVWDSSSEGRSKIVPIVAGKKYKISTTLASIFAILSDDAKDSVHFSTNYNGRLSIEPGNDFSFTAPQDARFVYLLVKSTTGYTETSISSLNNVKEQIHLIEDSIGKGATYSNDASSFKRIAQSVGNGLTPLTIPVDSEGNELPTLREVQFVQMKSSQMTDIVWTPVLDIPYQGTGDKFTAGEPITGLPYSSVKEIDKYIGFDVSIHTFMTAVNNPYSLLYTECIKSTRSTSAWNVVYHGVNDCCSYFGTVCSVLTGYSTGQTVQWSTGEDKWCAEKNLNMIKVYNQSAQGLEIGDIYWLDGHNRLILGLKRDSAGNVTHVQVSESVGKFVRKRAFVTAESFENTMRSEGAIIYRNIELYKNKYVPSEFVAVGNEAIEPYEYNDDICTFAGDKASFAVGNLVVLNYNLDSGKSYGWTNIEVYKDDVLIGNYTLSEAEQTLEDFYAAEGEDGNPYTPAPYNQGLSESGHALVLGKTLAAGRYKARMTDGTNHSEYTYWEVLQVDVTYSKKDNGTCVIAFESSNGNPLSYTICSVNGTVYAHNEITEEDVELGYVEVNLVKLNAQQYPNRQFVADMYLKVHFEGQYGRVTNIPFIVGL